MVPIQERAEVIVARGLLRTPFVVSMLALWLGSLDVQAAPKPPPSRAPIPADPKPKGTGTDALEPVRMPRRSIGLGFMVHVESGAPFWDGTAPTPKYHAVRATLTELLNRFDAHHAIATVEASDEFVVADRSVDTPILRDAEARGHHVGLHADLGFAATTRSSLREFIDKLVEYRGRLVELGISVTHVSGVCSEVDWVYASSAAGFEAVSGVVDYCLNSLPPGARPAGFSCENPGLCHRACPSELPQRIKPWCAEDGSGWLPDVEPIGSSLARADCEGEVVILPTSGPLSAFHEEYIAKTWDGKAAAPLTVEDAEAFQSDFADAYSSAPTAPFHPYYYYPGLSIGEAPDWDVINKFLDYADTFVAEGKAYWISLRDMNKGLRSFCP